MKINLDQTLLDYEGKDTLRLAVESKNPLTIREVFTTSLNSLDKDERMTAEDKSKIFQLSMKIYSSNEPDFTVDDLSFIKTRVGLFFSALVYGRICEIIDDKPSETPETSKDS